MNKPKTVPCELCGTQTDYTATKRCERCWELEHRVEADPDLANLVLDNIDAQTPPYLSKKQIELLTLLVEECGECIQAASKVLRHGYDSKHPNSKVYEDNRAALEREMGDVRATMILLCESKDVSKPNVHAHTTEKLEKVGKYLHHQKAKS